MTSIKDDMQVRNKANNTHKLLFSFPHEPETDEAIIIKTGDEEFWEEQPQ